MIFSIRRYRQKREEELKKNVAVEKMKNRLKKKLNIKYQ